MKCFIACICFLFSFIFSYSQPSSTLVKLIEQSNKNYAATKATAFRTLAAQNQSNVIKNQFKPQLQAAYQINYATYNNITGMVFPSFVTPISGPPAMANSYNGVFGSAAALIAKWDVVTFGYEKSLLQQANTQINAAKAKEQLQLFRQNVQLINTYLDWLLANKLVTVYQNNLNRVTTALQLSQTLTQKGLRPGTDSASWNAEYAKANILLQQQQKSTGTLFIQLQELIGIDTSFASVDTMLLNKQPVFFQMNDTLLHPELQALQTEIDNQKNNETVLHQLKKPTLSLYGTGYARGSGIDENNNVKTSQGLYFQRYNYGVAAQLSVPLFEGIYIKPKIQQQQQLVDAATEDYAAMQWRLKKQNEEADTVLRNAVSVASLVQSQQQSSNFLFNAVMARYKAGLISYADVVLAQQQLIQADADTENAKWEVWKSFLYKASVTGDLKLFLQQFK